MTKPERIRTLREILLDDKLLDAPTSAVCRRLLELDFQLGRATDEELFALSGRDQILVLVDEYIQVVENGGIHEFMHRLAGDFTPQILDALALVGATSAHRGLRQVCDLFPGKMPSRDQQTREKQIAEIVVRLPSTGKPYLDAAASSYIDENIYDLLHDYWQRHQ
jgi:hypothetical protein